jgi:hypothetical protein
MKSRNPFFSAARKPFTFQERGRKAPLAEEGMPEK